MTTYLLKLVLCSGILYITYYLFLENEKMHRYNRIYLLFSMALAFVVPLINIEWQEEKTVFAEPIYVMNDLWEATDNTFEIDAAFANKKDAVSPLLLIYLAIACLLCIRFSLNIIRLWREIRRSETSPYKGTKLVLVENLALPFSFLNHVFVNKNEWQTGNIRTEILEHELAHVRQKHSWDVLFIEFLLVICWFNPFFYLYRKAIRTNHEFLADAAVVQLYDTHTYQYLLLNSTSNSTQLSITSSFNYLITKKRILMMLKTTSPATAALRQVATIASMFVLFFLMSTDIVAQQTEKPLLNSNASSAKKDTAKHLAWVGEPIGSTKEGVSEDLVKEYEALVSKYFDTKASPSKQFHDVTEEDRARMETIFRQMTAEQQQKQRVAFLKPPKPLPRVTPTKEQFSQFKNAKIYGVWINEKKVSNNVLNQYTNTDFSQVFISKLHGAAKVGRSYTHQLDLMTNDYYEKYLQEAKNNKRSGMVVRSPSKTRIGKK